MRTALFLLLLVATPCLAGYPGAPASVVAGYIEADGKGLALDAKTAPALLNFTTWRETPGWDAFTVIKSYEIGEVGYTDNTASVTIIYEVLGQVSGLVFTAKPAQEEVSFDVIKKKGRWKIVKPQLPPHLFVAGAIAALEGIGAKDAAAGEAALKKLRSLE